MFFSYSCKSCVSFILNFFFRSEKSPINSKRIANVIEYLTFEAFRYTCRGLYENHKFLFTLQLALKISLNKGAIRHDEFQVLIKGIVGFVGFLKQKRKFKHKTFKR